ncbi:MAG: hypothetical protein H8D34_31855, partial [Chloroflexi bacterium]|nr:hypothetical protein [Chloroflexota bacterium]
GSSGESTAKVPSSTSIQAYVGNNADITTEGGITIRATSITDADASMFGAGGGLVDSSASIANVETKPTIRAYIGTNTYITAGGDVLIEARHGSLEVTPLNDGTFDAGSGVNTITDTIAFSLDHGLFTSDKIIYNSNGNAAIGGLESGRAYRVIWVDAKTLKMGVEFEAEHISLDADTITFDNTHELRSGDQMIFYGGGIDGLTNGSTYYVRVIDEVTIKLATTAAGATSAPAGFEIADSNLTVFVDADLDTITLAGHGFVDGDEAIYQAPGFEVDLADVDGATEQIALPGHGFSPGDELTYAASADAIGGLTDGEMYSVIVVDLDTIMLADLATGDYIDLDPASASGTHTFSGISLEGLTDGGNYKIANVNGDTFTLQEFIGSTWVDVDLLPTTSVEEYPGTHTLGGQAFKAFDVTLNAEDTITLTGHGFSDGDAVTYRGPQSMEISAAENIVDADADTIAVEAHGFSDGDWVVYNADGTPISGLTSGAVYQIVVVDADILQLKDGYGNVADVAGDDDNAADHYLMPFGAYDIGGLTTARTYYVSDSTADTFMLKDSNGDYLDLTLAELSNPLAYVGTHTIGVEGIDFASEPTQSQTLLFDLTSTSSGIHELIGAGGVKATLSAPSGDGIVTGSATGAGGGLVSVRGSDTDAVVALNVDASVGGGTHISAFGNIEIYSRSTGNVSSIAKQVGGGLVAVGTASAAAQLTNNNRINIGTGAVLISDGNVTVSAETKNQAMAFSNATSGGLVGAAGCDTLVDVDYSTITTVGQNAQVIAKLGDVAIGSYSSQKLASEVDADAYGLGGGAGANGDDDKGVRVDGATRTNLEAGARVIGLNVELSAVDPSFQAKSLAKGVVGAFAGGVVAHAALIVNEVTKVSLAAGSEVIGYNQTTLTARHEAFDTYADADARLYVFAGGTGSRADNDINSNLGVVAAAGSTIRTKSLRVEATYNVTRYHQDARSLATTIFAVQIVEENGELNANRQIAMNGTIVLLSGGSATLMVTEAGAITANNLTYDIAGTTINVHDITNADFGGIHFAMNSVSQGNAPDSALTGSPTIEYSSTLEHVSLINYSVYNLQVNDISPLTSSTSSPQPTYSGIQDNQLAPNYAGNTRDGTLIDIRNHGPGNLFFNGLIDNPLGETVIYNAFGQLYATGPTAIVRTNVIVIESTSSGIGTAA